MQLLSAQQIFDQLHTFDVKGYARSRNFIDGGVSKLSPYLTHGIITTKECVEFIIKRFDLKTAEKFLMELVWKEFFLQVQKNTGNGFTHSHIRKEKTGCVKKALLPKNLVEGSTKTLWINTIVKKLLNTGRLHNHKRMRLASWCCHWARLDWKMCADRTYYYFIDGELSANHLSWQWVNSTFANKPYFMNEDNLQKYWSGTCDSDLQGTYDEVSKRIFDPNRTSTNWDDEDVSHTLETPLYLVKKRDKSICNLDEKIRVLTPWKLDESMLYDAIPTIIVLDEAFTNLHPRSHQRLGFVQQYADVSNVPFVVGSYEKIIQGYLDQGLSVILDERRDPIYVDVQEKYKNTSGVTILAYELINTHCFTEPVMKFFTYRNKTLPFIKEMIH